MSVQTPSIAVLRGADRRISSSDGIASRHGLSFGAHYDADRTSFGALVAHNDDVLSPGTAYGTHEHRDVEILTWVLAGAMVHVAPDGSSDVVPTGSLQYLATGTGWRHDERCAGIDETRLLQCWLAPALDDPPPEPPERRVVEPGPGDALLAGPGGLVELRRAGVILRLLRLGVGEERALPDGSWRHAHVLSGSVDGPTTGHAGDSLEISGPGPCTLVAGPDGAEVFVVATA